MSSNNSNQDNSFEDNSNQPGLFDSDLPENLTRQAYEYYCKALNYHKLHEIDGALINFVLALNNLYNVKDILNNERKHLTTQAKISYDERHPEDKGKITECTVTIDDTENAIKKIIAYVGPLQQQLRQIKNNRGSNCDTKKEEVDCTDVKAKAMKKEDMLTFDDISGQETAKENIRNGILNPILYPRLFPKLAKGILFYGPPGTGKTLLAKAFVNELQIKALDSSIDIRLLFYAPKGSDLKGKYVGESEKKIRNWFKCASESATDCAKKLNVYNEGSDKTESKVISIIFIDEIEAIAGNRDQDTSGIMTTTVNALLQEMDGVDSYPNVIVMAATNFPWKLDGAILRRFDTKIYVRLPTEDDISSQIKKQIYRDFIKPALRKPKNILIDRLEDTKKNDGLQCGKDGKIKLVKYEKNTDPKPEEVFAYFRNKYFSNFTDTDIARLSKGLKENLFSGGDVQNVCMYVFKLMGKAAMNKGVFIDRAMEDPVTYPYRYVKNPCNPKENFNFKVFDLMGSADTLEETPYAKCIYLLDSMDHHPDHKRGLDNVDNPTKQEDLDEKHAHPEQKENLEKVTSHRTDDLFLGDENTFNSIMDQLEFLDLNMDAMIMFTHINYIPRLFDKLTNYYIRLHPYKKFIETHPQFQDIFKEKVEEAKKEENANDESSENAAPVNAKKSEQPVNVAPVNAAPVNAAAVNAAPVNAAAVNAAAVNAAAVNAAPSKIEENKYKQAIKEAIRGMYNTISSILRMSRHSSHKEYYLNMNNLIDLLGHMLLGEDIRRNHIQLLIQQEITVPDEHENIFIKLSKTIWVQTYIKNKITYDTNLISGYGKWAANKIKSGVGSFFSSIGTSIGLISEVSKLADLPAVEQQKTITELSTLDFSELHKYKSQAEMIRTEIYNNITNIYCIEGGEKKIGKTHAVSDAVSASDDADGDEEDDGEEEDDGDEEDDANPPMNGGSEEEERLKQIREQEKRNKELRKILEKKKAKADSDDDEEEPAVAKAKAPEAPVEANVHSKFGDGDDEEVDDEEEVDGDEYQGDEEDEEEGDGDEDGDEKGDGDEDQGDGDEDGEQGDDEKANVAAVDDHKQGDGDEDPEGEAEPLEIQEKEDTYYMLSNTVLSFDENITNKDSAARCLAEGNLFASTGCGDLRGVYEKFMEEYKHETTLIFGNMSELHDEAFKANLNFILLETIQKDFTFNRFCFLSNIIRGQDGFLRKLGFGVSHDNNKFNNVLYVGTKEEYEKIEIPHLNDTSYIFDVMYEMKDYPKAKQKELIRKTIKSRDDLNIVENNSAIKNINGQLHYRDGANSYPLYTFLYDPKMKNADDEELKKGFNPIPVTSHDKDSIIFYDRNKSSYIQIEKEDETCQEESADSKKITLAFEFDYFMQAIDVDNTDSIRASSTKEMIENLDDYSKGIDPTKKEQK